MNDNRRIPTTVAGVAVTHNGEPTLIKGELWVTLIPDDHEDYRVWEFSLKSGRIIQTAGR